MKKQLLLISVLTMFGCEKVMVNNNDLNESSITLMDRALEYHPKDSPDEKNVKKAGEYYLKAGFRFQYDAQCYVPKDIDSNIEIIKMLHLLNSGKTLLKKLEEDRVVYLQILEEMKNWSPIPQNLSTYEVGYEYEKQGNENCEIIKQKVGREYQLWHQTRYKILSNKFYQKNYDLIQAYESGDKNIKEADYLDAVNANMKIENL